MTFREKKSIYDLIDEYHWENDSLIIYIFHCNIQELLEFVFQNLDDSYEAEHGSIPMYADAMHICIENFDTVLSFMDLSEDEIKDMFEEE